MPIKIKSLAVAETVSFQLTDAADVPLTDESGKPCLCLVHGPGSRRYAQANARKQARLMAKLQRGKALVESADEQTRHNAEFLADITEQLDVEYEAADGTLLHGRELFMAVYSDLSLGFIADQVARKAGDWGNFSKGSPTP